LSYDEQLDFAIRQHGHIRTVVLPKGYDYRTPFLHADWVKFILSVPRLYRESQHLYKEILKNAYPELFSSRTKNNHGLPLDAPKGKLLVRRLSVGARVRGIRFLSAGPWGLDPRLNYIDLNQAVRDREDLSGVVYEAIQDLKRRGIIEWLDIDTVWTHHQRKYGNYGHALTLLASLEISLRVEERRL
jgi:hypothetical protein